MFHPYSQILDYPEELPGKNDVAYFAANITKGLFPGKTNICE
jgi:hypothetical protein